MRNNVILLHGKMRSGKNQTATYIDEILTSRGHVVVQDSMAQPLKPMCNAAFKSLIEFLNDVFKENNLNQYITEDKHWYEEKNDISRRLLQITGSELIRDRIDPDFWIKEAQKRFLNRKMDVIAKNATIYTDIRFKNELINFPSNLFNALSHTNWPALTFKRVKIERGQNTNSSHQSENGLDDFTTWDYVIKNDGSLDDLHTEVEKMLKSFGMI